MSSSSTDILGLCETFLDEFSIESIHVEDYKCFHDFRSRQNQGGLGVLIKGCITSSHKVIFFANFILKGFFHLVMLSVFF